MMSQLKEYCDDYHKALLMTADMEFWKHHQKLLQDSEHLASLPLLLKEVKVVCSSINVQAIASKDKPDKKEKEKESDAIGEENNNILKEVLEKMDDMLSFLRQYNFSSL